MSAKTQSKNEQQETLDAGGSSQGTSQRPPTPPPTQTQANVQGVQGQTGRNQGTREGRHTGVNDVDLSELRHQDEQMERLLQRFQNLKEFYANSLQAGVVTNGGFESGRPSPKIGERLRGDTSNAFTRPSLDALQMMGLKPESNRLATAEEIAAISAKLEGMGLPTEHTAPLFWAVARYCADTSSSPYSDPKGVFEYPGGALTRDAVFAIIRDHTTLRQFCRAFAPITWNQMLFNKSPPEGWQALGYSEQTKYAAFDVFDYVTNPAAIQPLEGLLRLPTSDEVIAHQTCKRLALDRNRRNARFSNSNAAITGGLFGKDLKTDLTGAKDA